MYSECASNARVCTYVAECRDDGFHCGVGSITIHNRQIFEGRRPQRAATDGRGGDPAACATLPRVAQAAVLRRQ
jgi:hypothetical protein